MVDAKKVPIKMNFKISLTGISDPGKLFATYSSRPLVLFYFAPKNQQSQASYSAVQKLIKEFEPMGLTSLAISVGEVTRKDILGFMNQNNASIDFAQDVRREFNTSYGTGSLPVIYLVYANGTFIRYTESNDTALKQLRDELQKIFPKKK